MKIKWDAAVEKGGSYSVLLVGAGPAGLYLAQKLSGAFNVLMVDAGSDKNPTGDGAGYYELTVSGRPYPAIGSRLSALGGSSNHWGGNTYPLPPDLFANGEPDEWPMNYGGFSPHLADAAQFLNVHPPANEPEPPSITTGIFADYTDLNAARFRISHPVVRFGAAESLSPFEKLGGVDYLANARMIDLELAGERISSVAILNRESRERLILTPAVIVLAMGGIENARLLLWAGRNLPDGNPLCGGPNALTGSYFAEHTYFSPVDMFVDSRATLADAVPHDDYHGYMAWTLSDAFRHRHDLRRVAIFPGASAPVQSNPDLAAIEPFYGRHSSRYLHLVPTFQFEQTPTRSSYVALDRTKADADGVALADLHWNILAEDIAAYRRSVLLFCGLLNQNGYAKSRLRAEHRIEDWSSLDLGFCNHHMGTTRMARFDIDGVVDSNCQVFGVRNLFVAGSSVFPSSGFANPTLNIVALAGRLAQHLRREFIP